MVLLGECHGSLISAHVRMGNTERANEMVQELLEAALVPKNAPQNKILQINLGASSINADDLKTRLRLAAKGHNKGNQLPQKKRLSM